MEKNSVIKTILDDIEYHEKLIQSLEKELKNLPEGNIYHRKIRNISRFYHYSPSFKTGNSSCQRYLGQRDQNLINKLLRKRFVAKSLKVLHSNLAAENRLLESYKPYKPTRMMKELCRDFSKNDPLLFTGLIDKDAKSTWECADYERGDMYPEQLKYVTQSGLFVRSKSESIIAGLLEVNSIPFRYEALLSIGGHNYYPDFTILNPQDDRIIYWEHFGMADRDDYEMAMNKKLESYKDNGIVQWDNLIVTFETDANPFNSQKIQKIIRAFLLL